MQQIKINIAVTFRREWERMVIGGIFLRKVFEFVIFFKTVFLKVLGFFLIISAIQRDEAIMDLISGVL